jgi:hypothetical protein
VDSRLSKHLRAGHEVHVGDYHPNAVDPQKGVITAASRTRQGRDSEYVCSTDMHAFCLDTYSTHSRHSIDVPLSCPRLSKPFDQYPTFRSSDTHSPNLPNHDLRTRTIGFLRLSSAIIPFQIGPSFPGFTRSPFPIKTYIRLSPGTPRIPHGHCRPYLARLDIPDVG